MGYQMDSELYWHYCLKTCLTLLHFKQCLHFGYCHDDYAIDCAALSDICIDQSRSTICSSYKEKMSGLGSLMSIASQSKYT